MKVIHACSVRQGRLPSPRQRTVRQVGRQAEMKQDLETDGLDRQVPSINRGKKKKRLAETRTETSII